MSETRKQILLVADTPTLTQWLEANHAQSLPFDLHAIACDETDRNRWAEEPIDLILLGPGCAEGLLDQLLSEVRARSPGARVIAIRTPGLDPDRTALGVERWLPALPPANEVIALLDSGQPTRPRQALTLKVVLGGEASVGKTSLMRYYATGKFEPSREMTIGVDFHIYAVDIEGVGVRLVVWDIAGQNRFSPVRPVMYRGSSATALVFDLHNRTSFYQLATWWREIREQLGEVPVLLLGNKADLPRAISLEEAETLARAWHIPYFETSCVDGRGVTDFFQAFSAAALRRAQSTPRVNPSAYLTDAS